MSEQFRLGQYVLEQHLATGGMAEVWLARAPGPEGFHKRLVVKKILPHLAVDARFVKMFLNEARVAALLNHPNLVQLFALEQDGGTHFLVMEYVPGVNLRALQRRSAERGTPIPAEVVVRLVADACTGLHYAHELKAPDGKPLGLVHRDISVENLLVSGEGQLKVVDFGIAKAAVLTATTAFGVVKGKFSCMSPEQATAQPLDCRSDIYSLGVVLYELLCGRSPIPVQGDLADIVNAILHTPVARPEGCSEALGQVVLRAMAREREQRPPTARQLRLELEAACAPASHETVAALVNGLFPEGFHAARAAPAAALQTERAESADSGQLEPTVKSRFDPRR